MFKKTVTFAVSMMLILSGCHQKHVDLTNYATRQELEKVKDKAEHAERIAYDTAASVIRWNKLSGSIEDDIKEQIVYVENIKKDLPALTQVFEKLSAGYPELIKNNNQLWSNYSKLDKKVEDTRTMLIHSDGTVDAIWEKVVVLGNLLDRVYKDSNKAINADPELLTKEKYDWVMKMLSENFLAYNIRLESAMGTAASGSAIVIAAKALTSVASMGMPGSDGVFKAISIVFDCLGITNYGLSGFMKRHGEDTIFVLPDYCPLNIKYSTNAIDNEKVTTVGELYKALWSFKTKYEDKFMHRKLTIENWSKDTTFVTLAGTAVAGMIVAYKYRAQHPFWILGGTFATCGLEAFLEPPLARYILDETLSPDALGGSLKDPTAGIA